jgi:hypothetical protein
VLDGNPLGDPITRRLPVLLPPGYDPDSQRRYPVIYGLTGYTGRGEMLLHVQPWISTIATMFRFRSLRRRFQPNEGIH